MAKEPMEQNVTAADEQTTLPRKAWTAPRLGDIDLVEATLLQGGGAIDCCLGS